ncbi:YaaR family protein [Lentibacillus cibarius]|uniref:DUF327 family protein n=1 Tax=Lentibacillus cibarius TaxID=2583219 RepID=A0A5S3QKP9_9BACI|nr:YaaR family protein [Lentibacillus cibarius]TMN22307.1 DUF327 family protein [Lentibacillus cibarius]
MKVNTDIQSQVESTTKKQRASATGNRAFQNMVQSQTQVLKQQELDRLMKDITVQGDKLARFRSFRDMVKFKRLVKSFLKKTVYNGLDLQKSHDFSMNGKSRKLAIVKEVDDKLIEITEDIMNQEKKTVDLLNLIGELKGLLVNLYT